MNSTITSSGRRAGTAPVSAAFATAAFSLTLLLAACGGSKDDQAAYDVCIVSAKADKNVGKAAFAAKEQSNIQGSTGDAGIRVNIPYELDGKKGLFQCIAEKQTDGKFKVTN